MVAKSINPVVKTKARSFIASVYSRFHLENMPDLFMADSSSRRPPASVFDRTHDNVAANGTIEDSRPSIEMFRLAYSRIVQIFVLFEIIAD